ncbi:MAG: VOC family protein [Flavobacteriales bacterium]|nr:VOC family protein [Flavobacteriales bacterium]
MDNNIQQTPFHLAIPVSNLKKAREFYSIALGFVEGRSSSDWVDYNFFGHQLVIHKTSNRNINNHNDVDGHSIPVPHFGVILNMNVWINFKERLMSQNIKFVVEPHIRFENTAGEQATMFFLDPCGNALEIKAFHDITNLFKK